MKNLYKLIGIAVMVAVIGFMMTACDDDPDPKEGLYGTWVDNLTSSTITITADTIKWQRTGSSSGFVQYTNVRWKAAENNVSGYKTSYPNGYTFTGTRTDQNYSGLNFGFVGLSANGRSICLLKDNIDNSTGYWGFTKQP